MNKKKILLIIPILLILGLVGSYVLLFFLPPYKPPQLNVTPRLEFTVIDSGVLDYGIERASLGSRVIENKKVVYLLSQLNGKDIKDVELNVELFGDEIPKDVYVLDYSSANFPGCTECEGMNEFKESLEKTLKNYGLINVNSTLNQIKIHQLDALTHRSIIIVPTGKIPSQLVGLEAGPDLAELMNKGFVVVFIGSDLSQSLNRDSSVSQISSSQLNAYNISYRPRGDLNTLPPYRLKKPAFSISNDIISGSMSLARKGAGYFLVLPRSIDIGWDNGTVAGEDVGRLIYDVVWQKPLTTGSLKIPSTRINESNSNNSIIFLTPSNYAGGWVRIYLTTNSSNNTPFHSVVEHRVVQTIGGTMTHKSRAARGEGDFTIDFKLSVNFTKPKDVNISVGVYDENLRIVEKQRAQRNIKLIQGDYSFSSNFVIDLENGRYILRAEDDDGYIYAQSLLSVPQIKVEPPQAFWDREPQVVAFRAVLPPEQLIGEKDSEPLSNRRVLVTVNSSPNVDLFLEPFTAMTDSDGRFNYSPPAGSVLSYGEYTFKINVSGDMVSINVKRTKSAGWFDNPINVVIVVFIIIIGIGGYALRRPEKPLYTIDVPDFPPLEKVVVPLSKFSILSIFDSVNKEYRWNFMPLSAQEIKNEMRRKLTYKGIPILVTDYNLEKILHELIEADDVTQALNFYGLKAWESKSGRNTKYLALFRLLRNFFINNAIPFTDLNERKDCDILATVKGESIYIHIYNDESTFKRALELIGAGRNFIVFESRRELDEILKRLDLSYTPLAVILKSEIGSDRITPIHPGVFGEMVGR